MEERLQKLLAQAGLCSRREAERWITDGRVTVNGRTASVGDKADLRRDKIMVDGRPLGGSEEKRYLMLYKPRGYVTTLKDERGRKTVADLVHGCGARVVPVGRLDYNSEGLLLLTNDGELTHRLLSPRYHVDKRYLARVDGDLSPADVSAFAAGMTLPDGLVCLPAGLELLPQPRTCIVTLREGKFHQVKRMLAACGAPVLYLKRLSMGPLTLPDDLPPGAYRLLTDEEISALYRVCAM